jgi:hypothetical protein
MVCLIVPPQPSVTHAGRPVRQTPKRGNAALIAQEVQRTGPNQRAAGPAGAAPRSVFSRTVIEAVSGGARSTAQIFRDR